MPDDERFKVTKGQLEALVTAIPGTNLQEVSMRAITVEGRKGILATVVEHDQMGEVRHKFLIIGDGVAKL